VSGVERLFAISSLGGVHLLLDADLVEEIAPGARARGSEMPCCDLGGLLSLPAADASHAILVRDATERAMWLFVEPGTRFSTVDHDALHPVPRWLRSARAPLLSVTEVTSDGRFGYELDLLRLLREVHEVR